MKIDDLRTKEIKAELDLSWARVNHLADELEREGYDVTLFGPKGRLCIQTEKVSVKAIKTIEVTL